MIFLQSCCLCDSCYSLMTIDRMYGISSSKLDAGCRSGLVGFLSSTKLKTQTTGAHGQKNALVDAHHRPLFTLGCYVMDRKGPWGIGTEKRNKNNNERPKQMNDTGDLNETSRLMYTIMWGTYRNSLSNICPWIQSQERFSLWENCISIINKVFLLTRGHKSMEIWMIVAALKSLHLKGENVLI